ncbi:MAG: hypothetical protein ACO1N0_22010 [Fluviicola sp.]
MKNTVTFPSFLVLCLILASCGQPGEKALAANKNSYTNLEDTLYLPFDTSRVLSLYDIKTKRNELSEFRNETNPELKSKIDTIEVTFRSLACDCPNWYDLALAPKEQTSEMSPDYAYYIEPASKELELPDNIRYCKVRLIGRHYKSQGWPKDPQFIDPHPPAGNVFRYYAYEMVLPVMIWGPYYHTGERETPSSVEESIMSTVLTINE